MPFSTKVTTGMNRTPVESEAMALRTWRGITVGKLLRLKKNTDQKNRITNVATQMEVKVARWRRKGHNACGLCNGPPGPDKPRREGQNKVQHLRELNEREQVHQKGSLGGLLFLEHSQCTKDTVAKSAEEKNDLGVFRTHVGGHGFQGGVRGASRDSKRVLGRTVKEECKGASRGQRGGPPQEVLGRRELKEKSDRDDKLEEAANFPCASAYLLKNVRH